MSGKVVLGVGASHSTLMNTHWHEVAHLPRAIRFRDALRSASGIIEDARPDVAVIVGSNHFRGLWLDLIPAFTIGVGTCTGSGESGSPGGVIDIDVPLARHVVGELIRAEVDVAFSAALQVDHGITHAVQYLLDRVTVPIVPVIVNVFAPPLPSLRRSQTVGRLIGDAVRTFAEDRRVVVIGSGGLSHRLPFPDWRDPQTEDDRFLVDAWTSGRTDWQRFDPRRREIIRSAVPEVQTGFDGDVLKRVETGTLAGVVDLDDDELAARGGNGAHELRNWVVAAAACGHRPGRVLAYSPMPEWLTGMAVAVLELEGTTRP